MHCPAEGYTGQSSSNLPDHSAKENCGMFRKEACQRVLIQTDESLSSEKSCHTANVSGDSMTSGN